MIPESVPRANSLVDLRELARHGRLPVAHGEEHLAERLGQPAGGFVEDERPRVVRERGEAGAALLRSSRQEALEAEARRVQAGGGERRGEGDRAGDGDHVEALRDRHPRDQRARVGDPRHPRVRDERDALPLSQEADQRARLLLLARAEVADQTLPHPVALEQVLRAARVLAGDEIDLAEDPQGAQGDILEVPDGRGDEVERSPFTPLPSPPPSRRTQSARPTDPCRIRPPSAGLPQACPTPRSRAASSRVSARGPPASSTPPLSAPCAFRGRCAPAFRRRRANSPRS